MSKASYFGTQPAASKAPELELVRAVDSAAEQAGFVSRGPTGPALMKRRKPVEEPVLSFTARVSQRSGNRFISWCDANRISYREGFDRLIELLDREEGRSA
jgi:hypothetical protein